MGKTPFKMRGFSGFGNSPMTKKSPAKDDPHTTTEEHAAHEVEPAISIGTINDAGTSVWDGEEWAVVGDSDLVTPKQLEEHKAKMEALEEKVVYVRGKPTITRR